jgi:eukaryotic-like serine/threonine-protein kinase
MPEPATRSPQSEIGVHVEHKRGRMKLMLLEILSRFSAARFPSALQEISSPIGMRLVLLPAGEFLMGSPNDDPDARLDEQPQHQVQISQPFYLSATLVTQAQYQQVTGENPSRFHGDPQRPVECVSWEDAVAFCRRLSELEDRSYRLPTEAEWEYACRADTTTRYGFGNDPSELGDHAWYGANSAGTTHPVMRKKPNPWGLYDMLGNVWEWCADGYSIDAYARSPAKDPPGSDSLGTRVLRGGCWRDRQVDRFRCAARLSLPPTFRFDYRGFRVVRTLEPETPPDDNAG